MKLWVNPAEVKKGEWRFFRRPPRRGAYGQALTDVVASGTKEPFTIRLTLIDNEAAGGKGKKS